MPFQPYRSERGPDFISLALQLRREQRQEESQNRRDEAALIRARSQAENDALSRAKTQIDIFREYTKGLPDASERAGVAQSLGDTRVEQAPEFLTNPEFQGPLQLPDEQLQQAFPTPESFAVTQYPELSAIAGRRANMLVQSGVDPSVAQQQAVRDLGVEQGRAQSERERELAKKIAQEGRDEARAIRDERRARRNKHEELLADPVKRLEAARTILDVSQNGIGALVDMAKGASGAEPEAQDLLNQNVQLVARELADTLRIPLDQALSRVQLHLETTFRGNEQTRRAVEHVNDLASRRKTAQQKAQARNDAQISSGAKPRQIEALADKIENLEIALADDSLSDPKRRNLQSQLNANMRELGSIGYRNVPEARASVLNARAGRLENYRALYAMADVYSQIALRPELFGVGASATVLYETIRGYGVDTLEFMKGDIARNHSAYTPEEQERLSNLVEGIYTTDDGQLADIQTVRLEEISATWFLLRGMNQSGRVAQAQIRQLFDRINVSDFSIPSTIGRSRVTAVNRNFQRQLALQRNALRGDDVEFEDDGRIVGDEALPPPLSTRPTPAARTSRFPLGAGLGVSSGVPALPNDPRLSSSATSTPAPGWWQPLEGGNR
tara:strand:+ start:13071 stop:14915 length:1845 start_codon:yes stop_codon:yes gene_type:complete